jgi:hypothetical protein
MLKAPPGAIEPEFQLPPTDVWVVESLLVHVTVPPTATATGLGANAVVVIVAAPATIETAPGPEGVVGVVVDDDEPHAAVRLSRNAMSVSLRVV